MCCLLFFRFFTVLLFDLLMYVIFNVMCAIATLLIKATHLYIHTHLLTYLYGWQITIVITSAWMVAAFSNKCLKLFENRPHCGSPLHTRDHCSHLVTPCDSN